MADIAIRVDQLERWRDGNGKPGAAAIIADHEKRLTKNEKTDECQDKELSKINTRCAVEKATEKQVIVDAVGEAMRSRGKSREGIVRAFGPYVAAIASIVCTAIATWR